MFCVVSVFSGIYLGNSLSACQLTGLWHQMNMVGPDQGYEKQVCLDLAEMDIPAAHIAVSH